MIDVDYTQELRAKIKVIGVGGGGNNAVDRMVEEGIKQIDFISANTDNKALTKSKATVKIQLGEKLTRGLGAGGKPEVGRRAAEETRDIIATALDDTDLLFITAGMGGGTGTGAAPVIAAIAREKGILTIGVVTKPFIFEGTPRMRNALTGIAELKKNVDTLVIIPNERLLSIIGDDVSIVDAFRRADEVLRQGVVGISGIILDDGTVNLDFADVRTIMADQGIAHMGIGRASGKNKIETAIREAINSPLLETSIRGAKAVLLAFTGDAAMSMRSLAAASTFVGSELDPDAEVMFGATIDIELKDEIIVTVIATGLNDNPPVDRSIVNNTIVPIVPLPQPQQHELQQPFSQPAQSYQQPQQPQYSGYNQPQSYQQPSYQQPSYQQPSYQQPSYQQSSPGMYTSPARSNPPDDAPPPIQTANDERDDAHIINEEFTTPPFLRDWKNRKSSS